MRPREPPARVSFRNIVAAERDAVADAVKRLTGRVDGYEMQNNPVAVTARGRHMAKNAGTGERGFDQIRSACPERSTAPTQGLPRRRRSVACRHVTRNGVGVDYVESAKSAHARQGGLAAPVRTGNDEERRRNRRSVSGQADSQSGRLSTRSPSLVRAI